MSYAVGAIQTAIVTLTATQIKNLFASPVTIVGAPGAGFFIQPLRAYFQLFPGTQMYAEASNLLLTYGSVPFGPVATNDNMDTPNTWSNVFKEVPYDNGVTFFFDITKISDLIVHKPVVTLTQVSTPGALTLTQVSNSADGQGTTTYTGTITGGGGNAFQFYNFTVTGFVNASNNGTFTCTASSGTTLTLQNANSIAETHAGTATSKSATYFGTFTNAGAWLTSGQRNASFTITGFTNSANNGSFVTATGSTTSIVAHNTAAVNETHAATATGGVENQPLSFSLPKNSVDLANWGAIATAKIMSGHSGTGYAPGDTGDIDDGGSGPFANYTVNTVGGTGIATFTLNSGGLNSSGATGYSLNFGYLDTNVSGGGSGAIFVPQTVTTGNGTGRIVCTYTILPI